MKTLLLAMALAAILAGCATGGASHHGATSTSRRVAPAKSAPAKVSFGGESRTRANLWNPR